MLTAGKICFSQHWIHWHIKKENNNSKGTTLTENCKANECLTSFKNVEEGRVHEGDSYEIILLNTMGFEKLLQTSKWNGMEWNGSIRRDLQRSSSPTALALQG